jgi:hypothetical protein
MSHKSSTFIPDKKQFSEKPHQPEFDIRDISIFMNKTLNCPIPNPSPTKGREFGQPKFRKYVP